MALFDKKDKSYLSQDDIYRIQGYKAYLDLFNGDHKRVFNNLQPGEERTYIAVNIPRLICNVSADLLFGDPPKYIVEDALTQEAIDRLIEINSLHALCHESATMNAIKGDTLFKVRFGKRHNYSTDREVIIETVKPDIYFPEIDPQNIKNVISMNLAWLIKQDNVFYLRVERHTPGYIYNELWLSDEDYTMRRQIDIQAMYPNLEPIEVTGIDDFLVVHVPNLRVGDSHFGQSDFKSLEPLFDELNNRLSQISEILDKHAKPKLAVPEGIISSQGFVRQDQLDLIEVTNGGFTPTYITWDAALTAAYEELDRIINLILMTSEISPSLLGMDNGGLGESGRALKYRLYNTLRKINKKRVYYDSALKRVMVIAEKLENVHGGYSYKVATPDIQWGTGLPDDAQDNADIAIKLYTAGLITKEKALYMIYPDLSEEAIQNMVASDKPITEPTV